jgi:hypothetical protein
LPPQSEESIPAGEVVELGLPPGTESKPR